MLCTACGAENFDDACYCALCSAALTPSAKPARVVLPQSELRRRPRATVAQWAVWLLPGYLAVVAIAAVVATRYAYAEYPDAAGGGFAVYVGVQFALSVAVVLGIWWAVFRRRRAVYGAAGERVWDANDASRWSRRLLARPMVVVIAFILLLPFDIYVGGMFLPGARPDSASVEYGLWLLAFPAVVLWAGMAWPHKTLAEITHARWLAAGEYPALQHAVEELSVAAGLATPPVVCVYDSDSVNAWVSGAPDAGAVGFSSAMAEQFSSEALRGVSAYLVARLRDGGTLGGSVFGADVPSDFELALETQVTTDEQALLLLREPEALLSALRATLGAPTHLPVTAFKIDPGVLWTTPHDLIRDSACTPESQRIVRVEALVAPA